MSALFDAIARFGKPAWGRGGGCEERPPFLAWRFEDEDPDVMRRVTAVVDEFSGRVPWILYKGGRNWVLQPKQVYEFSLERQFRVDVEAADAFAAEFPHVVKDAHADVAELAEACK